MFYTLKCGGINNDVSDRNHDEKKGKKGEKTKESELRTLLLV